VMRRGSPCAERKGRGAQRSSTDGVRRRGHDCKAARP
jgi:hypothetical protein